MQMRLVLMWLLLANVYYRHRVHIKWIVSWFTNNTCSCCECICKCSTAVKIYTCMFDKTVYIQNYYRVEVFRTHCSGLSFSERQTDVTASNKIPTDINWSSLTVFRKRLKLCYFTRPLELSRPVVKHLCISADFMALYKLVNLRPNVLWVTT